MVVASNGQREFISIMARAVRINGNAGDFPWRRARECATIFPLLQPPGAVILLEALRPLGILATQENIMPKHIDPKAPCPCGSGKKFKFCCKALAPIANKIIRVQEEDPEEALRLACRAEAEHPGNVLVLDLKFTTLLSLNRYDECLKLAREAVTQNPDYANGHYIVGDILFDEDDYRGALPEYEVVRRMDPDHPQLPEILAHLAFCYARVKDHQKALDTAMESLDTDEIEECALEALERLADDESTPDEIRTQAIDLLDGFPEDDSDDPDDEDLDALIQQGFEADDAEDDDRLLEIAESILDADPDNATGLFFRSNALMRQGRVAEALDDLGTMLCCRLEETDFVVDKESSEMLGHYVYTQGLVHVLTILLQRAEAEKDFPSLTEDQQNERMIAVLEREGPGLLASYYTDTWLTEPFAPFDYEIPLEASSSATGKAFFRKTLQALEHHMKSTGIGFDTSELRARLKR